MKIIEKDGNFFREIDGNLYLCLKNGYLKDYSDKQVVIVYGKLFKKATKDQYKAATFNIARKMLLCGYHWSNSKAAIKGPRGESLNPDGSINMPKRRRRIR